MIAPPPKRQTLAELKSLQRLAGATIMRPLGADWRTQRKWTDDRPTREVVEGFIKPNERLTSLERIEIYNRQYWFRLIDCLHEDYPGLQSVLGQRKFNKLIRAYLEQYPSRSFTLRNLGRRLSGFIQNNPKLVEPRYDLAMDMTRFEWAQVDAFDGPSLPPITVDDLLGKNPAKLKLAVQPYIAALDLRYPLDDYVLQLKQDGLRGEASNAIEESRDPDAAPPRRRQPLPRRQRVFVIVHRFKDSLYYKRLTPPEHRLLTALRDGKTLQEAIETSFTTGTDPAVVREIFETWTSLGWLCNRPKGKRRT
ncbi:MAG: DNA-binding domain-containing protein [Planctomycetota bacterium]|nr:DNA-binding domain-containing protein [Planctomycetota bacterium]